MTTLPLIITAILAALAANLGAVDLSAADQVAEGTYVQPPGSVAFACLPPARQTAGEGGARNAWYLETWEQRVRAWAPLTTTTAPLRASTSRALAMAISVALDNARANTANTLWRCVTWVITSIELEPSSPTSLPGWAYAELTVTFSFRRLSGTGT